MRESCRESEEWAGKVYFTHDHCNDQYSITIARDEIENERLAFGFSD